MAHPTASSSQPVQIPALDSPHAGDAKKPKDKKPKASSESGHPLEVCVVIIDLTSYTVYDGSFS